MGKTEHEKAIEALQILKRYNRLRNDLEAYLFEIINYGLNFRSEKPNPNDYGIEE